MGFSTLIDIMGSIIIGGMLMMILFRLNDAAVANSFQFGGELLIQKNLVEVVDLLEFDLRKIGYCADWKKLPNPSKYIVSVDKNSIKYLTDVDSDGNVDSLSYYLGPPSELSKTANPRDRMLYRKVNNERPLAANLGVTAFEFTFFDVFGNQIPFPIAITWRNSINANRYCCRRYCGIR